MKFWLSNVAFLVASFFLALTAFAYPADYFYESQSTYVFSKNQVVAPSVFATKHINTNVRAVSLDQMIGQMLMLGFSGTKPADQGVQNAQVLLSKGQIGGVILLGSNLQNKQQVKKLISFVKQTAPKGLPPFIAIDQEGGAVQRLRAEHGFTDIPKAIDLAGTVSPKQAFQIYRKMAKELAFVGFNVNFGPVVDLNIVPDNPIIGLKGRSYGVSSSKVQDYARAFVLAHRHYNILTSLKHFPGHGSSWTDSHEEFVDVSSNWKKSELAPYKRLIKHDLVDMVMVGHLYHPSFSDKGKIPASLSQKAIETRLRREIGYKGLVITDDLGMGAVKKYFAFDDALLRAIKAGNDILLLVDGKLATPHEIARIHKVIRDAIKTKQISLAQIKAAYQRIVRAKKSLAIKAAHNL